MERAVLGFVMAILAWAMERVVIRAMKKGRVKPAPRTAATAEEPEGLAAAAQEVGYQPKG